MTGEFFATPTATIATFSGTPLPTTRVVRCEPGVVNLEKLVLLDEATLSVLGGALSPAAGSARVHQILESPPRFDARVTIPCYGIASAALALVFGGDLRHCAAAGLIGLAVGLLAVFARPQAAFTQVFELVAACLASVLAHASARWLGGDAVYLTTVTGLIVLVPGLTLTVALTELAMANLVSGTARLIGAGVTFLKLGFGVAVGGRLGSFLFGEVSAVELPRAPLPVQLAGLLCASVAISTLFQARPRDMGWIFVSNLIGLAGATLGTQLLGSNLGPGLGTFLTVAGSNLGARVFGRPARLFVLTSIVLLVPGSVGFRSVSLLLERDIVSGVDTAFHMALTAISLVAGVLFANLFIRTRRHL